jgi:hypothetical protein
MECCNMVDKCSSRYITQASRMAWKGVIQKGFLVFVAAKRLGTD